MKKLISIMLSIMLLCSVFAGLNITTSAEEESGSYQYRYLDDGTVEISDYLGDISDVSVPGIIDGYVVTAIGMDAFGHNSKIISVTLPDTLEYLDIEAFAGCKNLKEIDFGTGIKKVGGSSFADCVSLESVTIPDNVTEIHSGAFENCTSLSDIKISRNALHINGEAFYNTKYYNDANNWQDGVLYIDNHLIKANSSVPENYEIKEGTISIAQDAFKNRTNLKSVTIASSVESIMYYAFSGCTNLSDISFSGAVKKIYRNVFENTAYYNNEDNWEDGVLYIGNHLIKGSRTLEGEYVTKDGTVSIARDSFSESYELTSLVITEGVKYLGLSSGYELKLESMTIPASVEYISGEGYYYLDNSMERVYISDLSAWCKIEIEKMHTNPLYAAGELYLNGKLVNSLVIPEDIKVIKPNAFTGWSGKELVIPETVSEIGDRAFALCVNLNKVSMGESVGRIGASAFSCCYALKNIVIPDSISEIERAAFSCCTSLLTVTIPDSVKVIGTRAFNGCESLFNVVIPESVKTIRNKAFYECENIENVYINDMTAWCKAEFVSTTSNPLCYAENLYLKGELVRNVVIPYDVAKINILTFFNYDKLISVQIPDTVVEINVRAFSNCDYLKHVLYSGTEKQWKSIIITGSNDFNKATRHYEATEGISLVKVHNTCTEDGYAAYKCAYCSYMIKTEIYKAPGHAEIIDYGYEPTCTKPGFTDGTHCAVCLETLVAQEEIPATGEHQMVEASFKEATCEEGGYAHDSYCKICQTPEPSVTPPLGHDFSESVVVKEVTCEEDGEKVYTCSRCGETKTVTVASQGHVIEIDKAVAPTCTKIGLTEGSHCSVCYEVFSEQHDLDMTAHKTKTVGKKSATYFAKGHTGNKVCKTCGKIISKGKATAKLTLKTPKIKVTGKGKKVYVKYNKVKDATGFQVKYYKVKGKVVTKNYNTKKSVKKSITDSKNTITKLRVRAYVKKNGKTAYSGWTTVLLINQK